MKKPRSRRPRGKPSAALVLAVAFAAGAFLGPLRRADADEPRPNILFLFADDQRPDTIGAFGNGYIETPHLDRLVRSGFRFRRTYCMGSFQGAVCVPSRAMVHSGRAFPRIPMDLEGIKTLPERLSDVGYETFGTGKWHNGAASFRRGFERARAVFFGGMCDHTEVPVVDRNADGSYTEKRTAEAFSSELFADAAIDFLESRDASRPFFAYVAFTAPHDPRMPRGAYARLYDPASMPLPPNFLPQHPFDNGALVIRDEVLAAWPRTPAVIRSQLAEYYALVSHLDTQVGRILRALEDTGAADDTVVIYAADHGLAMGSHGLLGKQNLYEHSTGAPLVLRGPGIPPGGSSDALTYLFDLFPTICRLAGAEVPADVDGEDLAPLWRGETITHRDSLITLYADSQRAVRDHRWKLIRYPRVHRTQLFDLAADPYELRDLSDDPTQAGRIERMTGTLRRWQQRIGDELPLTAEEREPAHVDLSGRERTPDRHQPADVIRKYF